MKKRKPDALKLACVLLAILLTASGATMAIFFSDGDPTRTDIVSQHMQDIKENLNASGKDALERSFESAPEWLGSEEGNLILMDANGAVSRSLNANVFNGFTLRMVVSPYFRDEWSSFGYPSYGALALLLDEDDGQILQCFHFELGPDCAQEDIQSFNRADPARSALFPTLNQALYNAYSQYLADGSFTDWEYDWTMTESVPDNGTVSGAVRREEWMNSYAAMNALASGATQADVDAVKRYCQWERNQLEQAGDWCAQMTRSGERYALALYQNNEATNAAYDATLRRQALAENLFPIWLLGIVVLIVLMAVWVLRDARSRDFKPALWGILTLMGSVVTLIVYLIVRPADSRCPACGASVKRSYMVCPMCASPLRVRCSVCGRAQEDAWVCCPYCGNKRDDKEKNALTVQGQP